MSDLTYILTASIGATLFVGQLLLGFLGLGGDHDLDHLDGHVPGHVGHDAEAGWFFGLLSYRALTAALMFFGLSGLAARAGDLQPWQVLAIAVAGGVVAMLVVAGILRGLYHLRDDGTEQIEQAVGARGVVYLTIPGRQSGFGKVHLDLQNRTVELRAVTFQDGLVTGTDIIVTGVIGTDTVEVVAAPETARASA